jgi:DNA-binding transcriptional LysR family regulator
MELRHLRYFCAVAEHGGFSSSARVLHVAQSAISEQISDLEREVGVKLLDRRQQKVRLTGQGEVFLIEAKKVLAAADHAVDMAQRSGRGEIGTLKIGFFPAGTGPDVPAIIKNFRRLYPGVRVSVHDLYPGQQTRALLDGVIDVGFTRPVETPLDQLVWSELLYWDPMMAVFPKDHPLGRGRVDLKSLAREPFVMVAQESSPSLFGKILALCSQAGFSPHIVSTGAVWASVTMLVEAGEGIAILPGNVEQAASKNLVFRPLTNRGAAIELVMAWSRERESPVLKAFLDLVRAYRNWPNSNRRGNATR